MQIGKLEKKPFLTALSRYVRSMRLLALACTPPCLWNKTMSHRDHEPVSASPPEEEFLNRDAAAKFLHLAPSTLATWASRGKADAPPMRRHGRRVVYAKSELLRWSAANRIG
jgi:hypothetical protein